MHYKIKDYDKHKTFKQTTSMKKIHINNDDNYATPPELYEELNKRFYFDFDPCPYNEGEIINDGLKIEWGNSNFVNPPYSQKLKDEFDKECWLEEFNDGDLTHYQHIVKPEPPLH